MPAANIAELETLTPAAREVAVTRMLTEARSWLAHAVEATEPQQIADFKAFVATVAETTRQLNLSKEIQVDAGEMVRRAERGVGLAIRKGQEAGEIRRQGDNCRTDLVAQGNYVVKPSPYDIVPKREMHNSHGGIADLTDGVTDEQFEQALTEAKAEGNVSRANVVRKIRGEKPKHDRPEILHRTRRLSSDRIVGETVRIVRDATDSLLNEVVYSDLDRDQLGEWVSSLSESIKALRSLRTALEKELNHG